MTALPRTLAPTFAMLTLALLCVGSPAAAKDKKPVDPNKKTCRSEVPTGSMMAKSICHTPAEWAQIDANNAAARDAVRDHGARSGTTQ